MSRFIYSRTSLSQPFPRDFSPLVYSLDTSTYFVLRTYRGALNHSVHVSTNFFPHTVSHSTSFALFDSFVDYSRSKKKKKKIIKINRHFAHGRPQDVHPSRHRTPLLLPPRDHPGEAAGASFPPRTPPSASQLPQSQLQPFLPHIQPGERPRCLRTNQSRAILVESRGLCFLRLHTLREDCENHGHSLRDRNGVLGSIMTVIAAIYQSDGIL